MKNNQKTNINNYYDNLGLIVARGLNGEIGYQNTLIWKIKEDLAFFKQVTMNSYIIMGRKTYESMPKNLLGRRYIILSRSKNFEFDDSKIVQHNLGDTLFCVSSNPGESFWVIGGEEIYRQFLPYVSLMHITEILDTKQADAFFPNFSEDEFDRKNGALLNSPENISYRHSILTRKRVK